MFSCVGVQYSGKHLEQEVCQIRCVFPKIKRRESIEHLRFWDSQIFGEPHEALKVHNATSASCIASHLKGLVFNISNAFRQPAEQQNTEYFPQTKQLTWEQVNNLNENLFAHMWHLHTQGLIKHTLN